MITVTYTLRIVVPSYVDIDADTLAEIYHEAEPQDRDWSQKVMRWLGGPLADAENDLSVSLPEGWYARIEGGEALV